MIKKEYFPLTNATLVMRQYRKDIKLPGLEEYLNFYTGRSDSVPTARPDLDPLATLDLLAYSSGLTFGASDNLDDFLNSVTGVYGTDDLVWMTSFAPFYGGLSGVPEERYSTYTTGTVAGTAGEAIVTGTATAWAPSIWPGMTIAIDGYTYIIRDVSTDTQITLSSQLQTTFSGASYIAYMHHSPENRNYKFNIQSIGAAMFYSTPNIDEPISEKDITGPFYTTASQRVTGIDFDESGFVDNENVDCWIASLGQSGYGYIGKIGAYYIFFLYPSNLDRKLRYVYTNDPSDASSYTQVEIDLTVTWPNIQLSAGREYMATDGTYIYWCAFDNTNPGGFQVKVAKITGHNGSTITDISPTTTSAVLYDQPYGMQYDTDDDWLVIVGQFEDNTEYVWRTDDQGTTWDNGTTIQFDSDNLPKKGLHWGVGNQLTCFAPDTVNNRVYTHYSTDGGDTWAKGGYRADWFDETDTTDITYGPGSQFVVINSDNNWAKSIFKCSSVGNLQSMTYTQPSCGSKRWAWGNWIVDRHYVVGDHVDPPYYAFTLDGTTWFESTPDDITGFSSGLEWGRPIEYDGNVILFGNDEDHNLVVAFGKPSTKVAWDVAEFAPVSDESNPGGADPSYPDDVFRSNSFVVVGSYLVLVGCREYDDALGIWTYYPRRVRWPVPGVFVSDVIDWSGVGSGVGDLEGEGALLDARAVNNRAVIFESNAIGALIPRGYVSDPWEYDIIKQGLKIMSNPVTVQDMIFFIADDGQLWQTDGMTVQPTGSSFDATLYSDYEDKRPIRLDYSSAMRSLVAFKQDEDYYYLINLENGSVSRCDYPTITASDGSLRAVVPVENAISNDVLLAYNPQTSDTDTLTICKLDFGSAITGQDEANGNSNDDAPFWSQLTTGLIDLVPDGDTTSVKDFIIHVYSDGTANTPIIVAEVKGSEDDQWWNAADAFGTISVSSTNATGTSTAFSNLIEAGNDAKQTFDIPCYATKARVYWETAGTYTLKSETTDYTISGAKQISFAGLAGPVPSGTNLYVFWDSYPEVIMETEDIIKTADEYHVISSITNATAAVLERTLAGSGSATHYKGVTVPNTEGYHEIAIGVNRNVEDVQFRLTVVHRGNTDATKVKIIGLTVRHEPSGKQVLEATGT